MSKVRDPLLSKPGTVAKQDGEYHREEGAQPVSSVSNTHWMATGASYRTADQDRLGNVCARVDRGSLSAYGKMVLVMDNLKTHTTASLVRLYSPVYLGFLLSAWRIPITTFVQAAS